MNWNQALTQIRENIQVGDKIDAASRFRTIKEKYHNSDGKGYKVWIGTNSYVKISETMLEKLFIASLQNGGIYNGQIFRSHFMRESRNHPCHVHVVGKIFEKSGVTTEVKNRNYYML